MRQPKLLPMEQSPFDLEASGRERHERLLAVTDDVVTDENGVIVGFRGEDDVEALLTDPRFSAVAMPMLALSGG